MKEFSFSIKTYISEIFASIIIILIVVIVFDIIKLIMLSVLIPLFIYDLINKYKTKYIVSEDKLIKKNLFKTTEILNWKEVEVIARTPYIKNSIGIFSKNGRFIASWIISSYLDLIKIAIDKCGDNSNIYIDKCVIEMIENSPNKITN